MQTLELSKAEDLYDAIFELKVRGAPAIGICAGYAMYVLAKQMPSDLCKFYINAFRKMKDYLNSSRPHRREFKLGAGADGAHCRSKRR